MHAGAADRLRLTRPVAVPRSTHHVGTPVLAARFAHRHRPCARCERSTSCRAADSNSARAPRRRAQRPVAHDRSCGSRRCTPRLRAAASEVGAGDGCRGGSRGERPRVRRTRAPRPPTALCRWSLWRLRRPHRRRTRERSAPRWRARAGWRRIASARRSPWRRRAASGCRWWRCSRTRRPQPHGTAEVECRRSRTRGSRRPRWVRRPATTRAPRRR